MGEAERTDGEAAAAPAACRGCRPRRSQAAFIEQLNSLKAKGYHEDLSPDDPLGIRISTRVGYPQIYMLGPDRNIIKINASSAD